MSQPTVVDTLLARAKARHDVGIDRTREVLAIHQIWQDTLLASEQFGPGDAPATIGSELGARWRLLGVSMGFVPPAAANVSRSDAQP